MSPGNPGPREDGDHPERIGPYRIFDVLGEGGMGTVYLAEQQEPVTRRVALKVIKLGMDSKAVVARFEQERQTLALMQHDGIAKVYDCGTTDTGQPYFVMELVQGTPLTKFCDSARLTLTQRLQLLQQVCSAVQHAHQKGVVHRDLKPGNVLVTDRDGKLQVKVIDFGLAKAMGHELAEATMLTAVGQVVGTPEYMAPEQADPTNLDIDTRADVYSLGVMLYELLVGHVPFSWRELRQAGLLEMQRILREVEPPRPSSRLLTTAGASSVLAEARRMSPSALRRALEQDLDWVVLKALEKDRSRRYESPSSLAEDLQRFLDHEPITAGPPSVAYRLRKFVRRHRTRVTVTTIVALTAVSSAFFVVREQWRAERHITEANKESAAKTSFLLAEELLRRGAWQQALDAFDDAGRLDYPDRVAIQLGKVQALDGIEPANARSELAKLDGIGLQPPQQAKLLLLRGAIGTDWNKDSEAGFETLTAARQLKALAPADDLYAQALLESDLRKAWLLLQQALQVDPGHAEVLRIALTLSVFVASSRDTWALVHQYAGVCPGDTRLPLMRGVALLIQEEDLDTTKIEAELQRTGAAEVGTFLLPVLRFLAANRERRVVDGKVGDPDNLRQAIPLVMKATSNPATADWSYLLHPSLLRHGRSLIRIMSGLAFGMKVTREVNELEPWLPGDRLWDVLRIHPLVVAGKLDEAWTTWMSGRGNDSFVARFIGRRLWEETLMRTEQEILAALQSRQAARKEALTAEQNAAITAWGLRVMDEHLLPPADLKEVVSIALVQDDNLLAIEASLRRMRLVPADAEQAKFWLTHATSRAGAVQWAHQLTADLLTKDPGNALLRSNQDIFESRLRNEVAYPQLEMRLRAELDKLREQPDATEAMTTARRALLWILTQWETEEPGKGHGEQAAVVRKDLGLEPR